jgi:hypothetical protein
MAEKTTTVVNVIVGRRAGRRGGRCCRGSRGLGGPKGAQSGVERLVMCFRRFWKLSWALRSPRRSLAARGPSTRYCSCRCVRYRGVVGGGGGGGAAADVPIVLLMLLIKMIGMV